LLDLPAILLSIPNLPVKARPQAGLSFAPWTFEIYFGYGESRFLSAFYGEEPQVMPVLNGSCQVRTDPFLPGAVVLGNRAWVVVFTTASVTFEKAPSSGLWTAEFHPPIVP
jgi:hypothetical protein